MRYLTACATLLTVLSISACRRTPAENSARMIQSGKNYLAKKDSTHAIIQFRRAAQYAPTDAEPYYQAGLAYLGMLDIPSAQVNLRKATELNPKHAEAQIRLAELLSASGDPVRMREASERARGVLKLQPRDMSALNTLAITEFKLGDPQAAIEQLEAALAPGAGNERTSANLALMRLYTKDAPGALKILEQAARQNPKSPEAAVLLGRMYAGLNNTAEAERELRRALALDPANSRALLSLGGLLLARKEMNQAEDTYRKLANLPDKHHRHMLALFYWHTGKPDLAIAELAKLSKADPENREARNRLVSAYRLRGKDAEANQVLEAAYTRNPKDLASRLQHAKSLIALGKFDDAAAALQLLVADAHDSFEGHYLLSKLYAAKKQLRLQQQELQQTLDVNPMFLAARLDMASSLVVMGRADAALDTLDHAPADQKSSPQLLFSRNWALLAKGEHAQVGHDLDTLLRRARIPEGVLQKALVDIEAGRYEKARAGLKEVLTKTPADTRALNALAASYVSQHRVDDALNALAGYAAQAPKSAPIQYLYSTWLSRAGKIDQARAVLQAYQATTPNQGAIDVRLAELAFAQHKTDEAKGLLTPILTRDPKNPRAQVLMGHIESLSGHSDSAIARYRAVIDLDPDNAEALNNVASLLTAKAGSLDEALKFAEKAKGLAANNPDVNDTLGWVLYRKGLFTSAVPYLQTAVKTNNPLAKYHLVMAYAQAGDHKRALVEYREARQLGASLPEAEEARKLLENVN